MFDDLPLSFQAELSLMINRKVLEKVSRIEKWDLFLFCEVALWRSCKAYCMPIKVVEE